jgi:hypothetical protein
MQAHVVRGRRALTKRRSAVAGESRSVPQEVRLRLWDKIARTSAAEKAVVRVARIQRYVRPGVRHVVPSNGAEDRPRGVVTKSEPSMR